MLPPTKDKTPPPADRGLEEAYRAARYTVNGIPLRIGESHPDFDRWLTERSAVQYTILTAHNPRSTPLHPPVNEARHATLLKLLDQLRLDYVSARGEDPAGEWPAEEGICLLNLRPNEALQIAVLYQQHAVVQGERGGVPRLVWV
ncbi:DUF3293 domain-containing protein [Lewinella sp. JB7]|uniref:DUF3293 domain-containing protein n=1 Tax=Lewinella sp. JB7 TaxID=2962887 RepID=UPI0020C9BFED|nr:DUF3293 domain-containing protein [Lewinella sp. JB7]MCP9235777.1 DUF3293 domain-containing protein [Lewinella sp. JB7]